MPSCVTAKAVAFVTFLCHEVQLLRRLPLVLRYCFGYGRSVPAAIRRKERGSSKIVNRAQQLKVRQHHKKGFATTNFQWIYFEKCVQLDLLLISMG